MPQIIPIRDLKNTGAISQMWRDSDEPIYITKNGYGDMVIMSMKLFEDSLFMQNVYNRLGALDKSLDICLLANFPPYFVKFSRNIQIFLQKFASSGKKLAQNPNIQTFVQGS